MFFAVKSGFSVRRYGDCIYFGVHHYELELDFVLLTTYLHSIIHINCHIVEYSVHTTLSINIIRGKTSFDFVAIFHEYCGCIKVR